MTLRLTIVQGVGRGQGFSFAGPSVTIGRGAGNDLVLVDPGVSRAHATLGRQAHAWNLADNGSANGTELNGALLHGPAALRTGDRIAVGAVVLELTLAKDRQRPAKASRWRGRLPRWAGIALAPAVAALALAGTLGFRVKGQGGPPANGANGKPLVFVYGPPATSGGVPPAGADLVAARRAFEIGRRKLEEKRIAPRNLYDAWKAFAEAGRQLEGVEPRPPMAVEAARLARDAERELLRQCGRLTFAAARFDRYGQTEQAQLAWREVLLHFPGDDPTGCRKRAQENLVPAQAEEAL